MGKYSVPKGPFDDLDKRVAKVQKRRAKGGTLTKAEKLEAYNVGKLSKFYSKKKKSTKWT